MTITLQLSADQERRLEEGAARHDEEAVRQVLMQAIDATLPQLLESSAHRSARGSQSLSLQGLLDKIASEFADSPVLPEGATTRAGIYGDHP